MVVFFTVFLLAGGGIIHRFWTENTDVFPTDGGEFVEGALGQVSPDFNINPLFTFGAKANAVEADLVNLIFSGLMRYSPETGEMEDFLADHTLSADKRVYTFVLKENLLWHDGYPVTAEDVVFTFRDVIQNPDFENEFLKAAFQNVKIEKIDDRTVVFKIPEPYKFFLTNFTVGIVPRHLLVNTPVKNLSIDSFNQQPVGTGPFKFENIADADPRFDEIRLAKFKDFILEKPKIDFITFRLYQDKNNLLADLSKLDSVRPVLETEDFVEANGKFTKDKFYLPQYVAVFINMEKPLFGGENGKKMRWALQLATNKDAILGEIPGKRIDTPLLEINSESWLSEYDPEKAAGALKDSGWILPGKVETGTPPADEASSSPTARADLVYALGEKTKYIYEPSNQANFQTAATDFYLVGKRPEGTAMVKVNGYQLNLFNPEKGTWSYKASTALGTLRYGENTYNVKFLDKNGRVLDSDQIIITLVKKVATPEPKPEEPVAEAKPPVVEEPKTEEKPAVSEPKTEESKAEPAEEPKVEEAPPVAETPAESAPLDNLPPVRVSATGQELTVKILTADSPAYLQKTAEIIKTQWRAVGIKVEVEALSPTDLLPRIKARDYDLLLYGQNLGYNLDSFPYWDLSQVKEGSNLSEYKSFEANVLLTEIRRTHDEEVRTKSLEKLREIITADVPAVFLFAPNYVFNVDARIKNVQIANLALFPDRFSNVENWYIQSKRAFVENKSWTSFPGWFFGKLF